jgi:hypothetical protein
VTLSVCKSENHDATVLRINVWPVGDCLFGAPSNSAPGARAPGAEFEGANKDSADKIRRRARNRKKQTWNPINENVIESFTCVKKNL